MFHLQIGQFPPSAQQCPPRRGEAGAYPDALRQTLSGYLRYVESDIVTKLDPGGTHIGGSGTYCPPPATKVAAPDARVPGSVRPALPAYRKRERA